MKVIFKEYAKTATQLSNTRRESEVRNQLVSLQADMEEASDRYYRALEEKEAAETAMEAEQVKIDAACL